VELGIAQFGGFADFYAKNVAATVFASVSDPDLQKQLTEANTAAAQAMNALKQTLEAQRGSANDKFALGPDLLRADGRADRCSGFAHRSDRSGRQGRSRAQHRGAQGRVRQLRAEGAARAMYRQGRGSQAESGCRRGGPRPAGDAQGLHRQEQCGVDPRSTDEALVAEAPPYNRSNAAFIQIPGPYDHGVAAVYNISPPDPKWSKAEQAAYVPSEATLCCSRPVHEVWPGHFLQFLHSNANPSKLESLWVGYAYAEGWAHYCEEMMIQRGLGKGDPEQHIGQITDALLRDVRLLSSIGLHTHGMTVAQSEKMFREQAFQDPGNARQQAARGTFDPAYLNYTLGKLMIRKLRTDWIAKHAGAAGTGTGASAGTPAADDQSLWHDFHDEFLSYGGPPIPLLRREMLGGAGGSLL
jgi:hypothetical protein